MNALQQIDWDDTMLRAVRRPTSTIAPAFAPDLSRHAAQARQDACEALDRAEHGIDPENNRRRAAERQRDADWYERLLADLDPETGEA